MKTLFRAMGHAGYVGIVKPLLFRYSPDAVHKNTALFAEKIQRIAFIRFMVSTMLRHRSSTLAQQLHGLTFENPVGLSAGFDKNVTLAPLIESLGFGFMVGGSVTGYVCAGNKKPWFHRLPENKALVVNAGLPNAGSVAVARRLDDDTLTRRRTMPLFISVARTNTPESATDAEAIRDYVLGLKNLRRHADVFELNISCPNTYGGEPFTDALRLGHLLDAVIKLKLQQPLFVKMPSNLEWPAYNALLEVIVNHGIQGVTVSNLRKDRHGISIDPSVKGNLSGKPTQALSDDLIRKTYATYGKKLTIIGVGGVFSAEDAYTKIKNGASLVALVTGLIYEGPQLAGSITKGLETLLKADGYTHISEAVGVHARDSNGRKHKS
jgi:dihydroorotate dehydrogenase (fumarate)